MNSFSKLLIILLMFLNISNKCQTFSTDIETEISKTAPQLIESRGFMSESHSVITDDGYVLGLFRVINPYYRGIRKSKPLLLWHGLSSSSDSFILTNPGHIDLNGSYTEYNGKVFNNCKDKLTSNLAFTLSACGWDVWMGNTRSNDYSKEHILYSNKSKKYWNYTLTEVSVFDVRNTVQYVLNQTNQSTLGYIGHSMGTTQMFILLSLIPEFEQYINPFIALGPAAYISRTTTLIRFFLPLVPIYNFFRWENTRLGLPRSTRERMRRDISADDKLRKISKLLMDDTFGEDSNQTDPNSIPSLSTNILQPISSNIFAQYGQYVLHSGFNFYDYGRKRNIAAYGRPTAPEYPLQNITSKNIVFIRGTNDIFCRNIDVDHTVSKLTVKLLDDFTISNPFWNHLDFISSIYANIYLNWKVLDILDISMNN